MLYNLEKDQRHSHDSDDIYAHSSWSLCVNFSPKLYVKQKHKELIPSMSLSVVINLFYY